MKPACPILFLLCALSFPASAASDSLSAPHLKVELVAENQSIQAGRDFALGLLFHLEKGWHVYWRNPGDSGSPPQVAWTLPAGFRAGAMEWPYPRRIPVGPLMNYGYEDEVLLITPVHAARQPPSGAATLGAALKWVVCQEVCIAGKGNVSLEVPLASGTPAPSRFHDLFVKTRKLLPRPASAAWKLKAVSLSDALVLDGRSQQPVSAAEFFPIEPLVIENAAPQIFRKHGAKDFSLRMKKSEQLNKPVASLKGILVTGGRAYEVAAPVVAGAR